MASIPSAILAAIERGDEEREDGICAAFHKLDRADIGKLRSYQALTATSEERNHASHEALVGARGRSRILSFRRILYHNSLRYRLVLLAQYHIKPSIRAEHRAIMEAAFAPQANLVFRRSCRSHFLEIAKLGERAFSKLGSMSVKKTDSGIWRAARNGKRAEEKRRGQMPSQIKRRSTMVRRIALVYRGKVQT